MDKEEKLQVAKKVITREIEKKGLKVAKIILFGSRAREDYTKDSDIDLYVIVDKEISFAEKRKITSNIRIKLAELKIPNDVIVQSESVADKRKNDVGYLTYYVFKEGVEVL